MTTQDSNLKKARQEERSDHLLGGLCVPSSEFYRHAKGHGAGVAAARTDWESGEVSLGALQRGQDQELWGL